MGRGTLSLHLRVLATDEGRIKGNSEESTIFYILQLLCKRNIPFGGWQPAKTIWLYYQECSPNTDLTHFSGTFYSGRGISCCSLTF